MYPSLPLFPYVGLSGEFSREALYAAKSDFERVVKACPIVSPALRVVCLLAKSPATWW